MNRRSYRHRRVAAALGLAVLLGACSGGASTEDGSAATAERVTVVPDFDSPAFVVNVYATDTGYETPIIHIPAGRYIKLVLRDHGSQEHHYRVIGLVPSRLRWAQFPSLDEYDIASMSDEELLAAGLDMSQPIDDLEHVLHHLHIMFVPDKPASPSGIKPLGTEVHGWTRPGTQDVIYFFALTTGTYEVVDSAHPEITGQLVVYLPPDATLAEGS
jgi:hypothetical protein